MGGPYREPAMVEIRTKVCRCEDPRTCVLHEMSIPMGGCPTRGLYKTRFMPASSVVTDGGSTAATDTCR